MPRRSIRALPALALLSALVAGCTVGPTYKRPLVALPDRHRDQPPPQSPESLADRPWWQVFNDPTLNDLVAEALKNGYDVRIAASRVEQARAAAGITQSQRYPQVTYDAQVGRGKQLYFPESVTFIQANVQASWEIDLWGRIRRLNEAALAQFLATEDARRGVIMSLVAEVATAYFNLCEADNALEISKRTAASFQQTADLVEKKLAGGAASALEKTRVDGALHNVLANVPTLERQVASLENQICILLGRQPGPVKRSTLDALATLPPRVPAGLPSSLLERRPDVRQAEQAVVAANANVGVAQAAYFPTLSLTGSFGGLSPELSTLFSTGRLWSVAAGVAGPIFNAGAIRNQKARAIAQWEESRLQYGQVVTSALGEVATDLMSHEKLAAAEAEQFKAVTAYREAVRLANIRYGYGLSAYFEVLDAMQQLFPVELTMSSLQRDRLVNYVNLYKALGGGWQMPGETGQGAVVSRVPGS